MLMTHAPFGSPDRAVRADRIEFVVFHTESRKALLLVQVKERLTDPACVWQVRAELAQAALNDARAGNVEGSTWAALTNVDDW